MKIEKHKHHIIPKHMGGDNLPDNLTPPWNKGVCL